jgi:hypothetical protein
MNLDEIRKEIAIKHNVLLEQSDPSLVTVTIFDSILEQSVDTLNAQQEANVKALLNSIQKSHEETKRLAKKVVDEGTEYACDQINTAIKAAMDECREEMRRDLKYAWEKIEESRKAAATWAAVSGTCTVIIIVAALANVL